MKVRVANIIGFAGLTVSVTTTPLCYCRVKAAIDNKEMNECGCVPIKLYLMTFSFEFHIICMCHKIFSS